MSLSEQFQKLHSAKQFEEICVLYDSSSVEDDELALDWDYVYLMNGLYNQKRYTDGCPFGTSCKNNAWERN